MNIQGKEILPSDVIALMRRAEEAEREMDSAIRARDANHEMKHYYKDQAYTAREERDELLKQNEQYDKLGLEALELRRERDRYHNLLLHLYGNQKDLDDILNKFEAMK